MGVEGEKHASQQLICHLLSPAMDGLHLNVARGGSSLETNQKNEKRAVDKIADRFGLVM